MGWAEGFSAGTNMARNWMDVYDRARQERLMAEQRQKAGLGDYQQHTAEYGQDLAQKIAARDTQNRPLWDVSIQPGSVNYDVRPISYDDSAATAAQPSYGSAPEGLSKYASVAPSQPFTPSPVATYPVPSEEQPDVGGVQGGRTPGMMPIPSVPQGGLQAGASAEAPPAPAGEAKQSGIGRTLGEALPYEKMKTTYMGKQYDGPLTPEMKRAAQIDSYADVYEQLGKPEEAMRLRSMAAQERRAAAQETRAQESHDLNQKLQNVQLRVQNMALEDQESVRKAMPAVQKMMAANPNVPLSAVTQELVNQGVPLKNVWEIATAYGGFKDSEVKDTVRRIDNIFRDNPTLEGLAKASLDDKDFDPQHHWVVRNVDGGVLVDTVRTDDPSRVVSSSPVFKSPEQAVGFLYQRSTNPGQVVEWTETRLANAAKTRHYEAAARESEAKAGAYERSGLGGGGTDTKAINSAGALVNGLAQQANRLRADLASATSDADRKQIQGQLNDTLDRLRVANSRLDSLLGGGSGARSDMPTFEVGRTYVGPDGKPQIYKGNGQFEDAPTGGLKSENKGGEPAKPVAEAPRKSGEQKPVDVSGDTVIATIRRELGKLDARDPANVDKIRALGTALNERKAELQRRYGAMTELKFE